MATQAQQTDTAAPKVHWRAMHDSNSDDFSSSDLLTVLEAEGVRELHVRVESATQGSVKDHENGKTKRKVSIKFVGIEKPYKSNVTNNNAVTSVNGSPFPVDWAGTVVTLYVGKAERGRRKGDPEGTPSKVIVDAVRIRPMKPAAGAKVYAGPGSLRGNTAPADPDFDLDGWLAAFATVETREEFEKLRGDLNKTKRPAAAREPLVKAVEAARVRLFGDPL